MIGIGKRSSRSSWRRNIERRLRPSGWKCVSESGEDRSHITCLTQLSVDQQRTLAYLTHLSVDQQRTFNQWYGHHFYCFRRIPSLLFSDGIKTWNNFFALPWPPQPEAQLTYAKLSTYQNDTYIITTHSFCSSCPQPYPAFEEYSKPTHGLVAE